MTAAPQLRQPRALVQVNGTTVPALMSLEIDETAFSQPSTFRVELAVQALPPGNDLAWWMRTMDEIDVEIFIGFPSDPTDYDASDLTSMFYGRADDVEVDWAGQTMSVSGRDLSAKLADVKSAQKYVNQKASDVATMLAAQYGLTPKVTPTKTPIGKFYSIDHVDQHDDRTQWDLLSWLARDEQFVVFVQAKELHFQPKPSASQTPQVFHWTPPSGGAGFNEGNFIRLSSRRELTVAKGIKVEVKSWNSKKNNGYSKTAQNGGQNPQTYSYVIAGLEPDDCQARAKQLLAELSQHEKTLTIEGPADNSLTVADVIQLSGTGTALDQIYFPSQIKRTFDAEGGYRWEIEAKLIPPADEAQS